jgi:hypothetical protein
VSIHFDRSTVTAVMKEDRLERVNAIVAPIVAPKITPTSAISAASAAARAGFFGSLKSD